MVPRRGIAGLRAARCRDTLSPPGMLPSKIRAFLRNPSLEEFDTLAHEAFAWQYQRLTPYRDLCNRRGTVPRSLTDWRDIPPVPTRAYRSLELTTAEPRETFLSSGSTKQTRSVHRHPYPDLYRCTIDVSFPTYCLPGGAPCPILSLVPDRRLLPHSSLAFMVDHILRQWGLDGSTYAIGEHGVEVRRLRSWLGARQRDARPGLLVTTSFALADTMEALHRLGLRFRLPPGSVVFETGGYKGRRRELTPGEIEAAVEERLGISSDRIVREYGMTELTSQLYSPSLAGGPTDLFDIPHWCRVRCLDPETLSDCPEGSTGLIALLDLANIGSSIAVLTEDLGCIEDGRLRLIGRARGSDLRGCSLTAEDLASSTDDARAQS